MLSSLSRLCRDTRGSVTVEFVIIFPAVILLILFIIYASILLATVSDVQQLAFELARASIGVRARMTGAGDLCTALNTQVLPQLISQSTFITASSVSPLAACPAMPDANGYFTASVRVNLMGNSVAGLAQDFGVNLGSITRTATIRIAP